MIIYISNLGSTIKDEDLRAHFAKYGTVSSARVALDDFSKESRGFGFVEMPDQEAAQTAIKRLNGAVIGNNSVKVTEAEPHNKYNSDSFFNRW
jgi:RNA recognition motif-containing protein